MDGNLRQLFRKHLPHFHWVSVETGSTGRGIPDSEYCHAGVSGWIEFKKTSTNASGLRPEQIAWLERRGRAGGRCWAAVRRQHSGGPRKGHPVDELYLIDGKYISGLINNGVDWSTFLRWKGGPAHWDWSEIERALLT